MALSPSIQEVESTTDVANIFELSISERIIIERLCASIGTNLQFNLSNQ